MEKTFVMIKPDGVQRGYVGEIISRFESKGLKLVALKMLWIDEETAREHYAEHKGKDFYRPLINYITSGPVVAMLVEGDSAIKVVRKLVGKTDPKEAKPGTIRGDLGLDVARNVVHAADSEKSAERELNIFFDPEDIKEYELSSEEWLYE